MLSVLRKIWLIIFPVLLIISDSYAQTRPCELIFKDGKGMRNARLIGLHQDLLLVSDTGSYKIINVEKVARIKFDNGTYVWTGAAIGAVIGFVGGIIYYELFGGKKNFISRDPALGIGVVITIPSALIGGVIGNIFRNIDDYNLAKMHPYMKSKEIKFIMKDHSLYE